MNIGKFETMAQPEIPAKSRLIIAVAFGDGEVLLCEESVALDFVRESGGSMSDETFVLSKNGIGLDAPRELSGVFVGELRIVDDGPESWEMPHIRDYSAEVRNIRPVTKEEWRSHMDGEWPEGWNTVQIEKGEVKP